MMGINGSTTASAIRSCALKHPVLCIRKISTEVFSMYRMSSRVGTQGHVLAFEPSPREFRHLRTHIRINRRANVRLENAALADRSGSMELFLTGPPGTTGNSLRRPQVNCVQSVTVPVVTLE